MNKKGIRKVPIGSSVIPTPPEKDGRVHWGHDDVLSLINKVKDHWPQFCNGVRKKKYIWKDIATQVTHDGFPVTGDDCDRKWRNLKIRYLAVLDRQMSGEKTGHRIDYFDNMHEFLKDDADTQAYFENRRAQHTIHEFKTHNDTEDEDFSDITSDGPMEWSDAAVQMLLDLLLEFRDWFTDRETDRDDNTIWETVSEQMKLEGHQAGALQCKRKWANLAQGFQHHKAAVEATGTLPLWPFYTRVRHVMKVVGMPIPADLDGTNSLKRRGKMLRSSPKKKKQRFFKQEVEDIDDDYTDEPSEEMLEMREPPITSSMVSGSARSPNLLDGAVTPGELQEVCLRLERLEENLAISRRLERLEARLDDAAQQREAQHQTNALLSQVLSEISRLSRTLTTRFSSQATVQESTDLGSGITIVVPHSQHLE
ncbi:uncharacterized protein LOC125035056 [Penaeus chinensis]|uniref:uncharacterized protein LOC125035056 n=1 Tax=Penaeus chinensis TaxID=139456 RepID=UPI001FB838F1|nr:uncharacterized protein LOC125035056 [Penaeus chinensis]